MRFAFLGHVGKKSNKEFSALATKMIYALDSNGLNNYYVIPSNIPCKKSVRACFSLLCSMKKSDSTVYALT